MRLRLLKAAETNETIREISLNCAPAMLQPDMVGFGSSTHPSRAEGIMPKLLALLVLLTIGFAIASVVTISRVSAHTDIAMSERGY